MASQSEVLKYLKLSVSVEEEPGNDVKESGFPRSYRPQKNQKFVILNFEIDIPADEITDIF